jgi:hypothetical protein
LGLPHTEVTIHTMGFAMKPSAAQGLRLIAERFQGIFSEVQVSRPMVDLSARMNRPRNRAPNGVWGITLGGGFR